MKEVTLLQQAISAARAGHELTARDIFLEIVEINPNNEIAWVWLIGLLDDPDDCIHACEQALRINPNNVRVREHLRRLLTEKEKKKKKQEEYVEEQAARARKLLKANKAAEALELLRLLTKSGHVNAEVWRLLAKLSPDMDERLSALEQLLARAPEDARARRELQRLQRLKSNPLELAEMYEEQGEIQKAINACHLAALRSKSKSEQNAIYWKIMRLENLRQEKITHISPSVSIARLAAGPPLLYFMLMLIHVGVNPFAQPDPLNWIGFLWTLLGGFLIAFASVRSRSRLWFILFNDSHLRGTPAARFSMAAAGWILVIMPYVMIFYLAFLRLQNYTAQ